MANNTDRFAIAQAMYSQLASAVKTRDASNLRGEFDADIKDKWLQTDGLTFPVKVAGETVGTASVKVAGEYEITDSFAFDEWAERSELNDEVEEPDPNFDWQAWAMRDPDYYNKRQWIRDNIPGFFRTYREIDPNWRQYVVHDTPMVRGLDDHKTARVYDVETGEELVFLRYTEHFDGTTLSGVKWDKPPKKYAAVRDVLPLAGINGGNITRLLE